MGKVLVVVKVLPKDISINLDELYQRIKENLPEILSLKGYKVEEIAFGLKSLKLYFSMPDNVEGGTSVIEDYLNKFESIEQIEIEFISLLRE
ncbi:MAG: elongation factor 1-beta [Thermoproteota archaeon]|jgi:elongation factor 1-beta|nr:elongation factor 1-beta [Thermoproteota archaeon]